PEYSLFSRKHKVHLRALIDSVDRAAQDKRIGALFLSLRHTELGWAQAEEFSAALDRFRGRGKKVVTFLESAGNKEYLIACSSDALSLLPSRSVNLIGLQAQMIFLKDVLQWLGIHPELAHVGKFKSAGDMLTRNEASSPHRQQTEALIGDLQHRLVEKICSGR